MGLPSEDEVILLMKLESILTSSMGSASSSDRDE